MKFLKALFFNFLIVFFANHVLPGIEIKEHTRFPHIGGDISFALSLGLLNTIIYPILKLVGRKDSVLKIAMFALVLNLVAYAIVKFLPVGIQIRSVEGYIFGSLAVAIGSFLTNLYEMSSSKKKNEDSDPPTGPPSTL